MSTLPDLDAHAERHLAPLGITVDQARHEASRATATDRYATPAALDVLRRLHAQAHACPTPTSLWSPVLPPTLPVTITQVPGDPDHLHVHHDGETVTVDTGHLLAHLTETGITQPGQTHRSLIVETPDTLRLLADLTRHPHGHHTAAAVLDWWTQRAEHPGTGAAFVATDAAALRWVTGEHPTAERHLDTWHRWLDLDTDDPAATAHALVTHTSQGHLLAGMLDCHTADSFDWKRLVRRDLNRWRAGRETHRDAALGLTSRCHAAEYFTSLRLEDPTTAQAALRDGQLMEATITTEHDDRTLTLTARHTLTRLRVGNQVQAWAGTTQDADPHQPLLLQHATVHHVRTAPDGTLQITLTNVIAPRGRQVGTDLTLRPRRTDPHQQARLRGRYHSRLRDQRNWLARTTATAPTTRRHVPLDVVLAAAEPDPT